MAEELDLYTGSLTYRGIDFKFAFNKVKLRLIPPKEKIYEVSTWFMKSIAAGVFTNGDPVYIEDPFLTGKSNETGQKLIFIPERHKAVRIFSNVFSSYYSVLIVAVEAYVTLENDRDLFDCISFQSLELNYIYPVNQAIDMTSWTDDGVLSLTTKNVSSTTSEKQHFSVDGKEINVHYGVSRKFSTEVGKPSLSLYTSMIFDFKPISDYSFVYHLWRIAKTFIQYLCYRKNVILRSADIAAPYKDGKHEDFAVLHVINEIGESEPETLTKGRYIKYTLIAGNEGKILSDIASDKLYLRHLPNTYQSGRHIDAARFVMITAAFEWEFHRNYLDGVTKKDSTIKAEQEVTKKVETLIDESTGSIKQIYKFLRKQIKSDSLQSEIEQIGKDYSNIIDVIGKRLYALNNEKLIYSEMGKRLSDQRNHFAHGDLDKNFIGLSLLDLIYLEYIVYAIQLKSYGITENNIKKAINDLFDCGINIP